MKKYIAYYRKSSDTEDKQALSLKDQERVILDYAKYKNLYIPKKLQFRESKTAKAAGRPIFNEIIELVEKGKATGIIAWKVDRLTRNPDDTSTLLKAIEKDIEIWTIDFGRFENTSSHKLMFNILATMAKFKVDDLSENVKRSLVMKTKLGWWPGWAPFGYLNIDEYGRIVPKQHTPEKQKLLEKLGRKLDRIEKDPVITPLIVKAFEFYYYQDFSLKTLCHHLNKEGLVSRNGGKITKTSLEQILKNPFYYGVMRWKGEIRSANHEPIIDKTLFDGVQEKLSGKSPFQPQPQKLDFLYRGLLFCGECGCSITAERHTKKQKNGNIHRYIYYRCTKTKGNCGQAYINEPKLELEIAKIFKDFVLSQERADAIQKKLKELFREDISYQERQETALKIRLTKLKNEKKNLFRKMMADKIKDKETCLEVKNDIQSEVAELQEKLANIGRHSEDWLQQSSNLIYLAKHADELFLEGTKEEKHTLINCVASNLFLRDKKVHFSLKKPFAILAEGQKSTTWLPG